jgi:site-specific recombinase XerD
MLYKTGCRVSEIISIRWSDIVDYGSGAGIIKVMGKGEKERSVLVVRVDLGRTVGVA